MAEVVELRREGLLPEYELMKKHDLFSDEEIRMIIKSREAFEYKIGRQTKSMKDFIEYITYERNLKSKVGDRWSKLNQKAKCPVESSIASHIRSLYKQALGRFPHEIRLWTNYLKFCKNANFMSDCSSAFDKMLQYHGDKPDIWIKAAMWEYEINNLDRAKDYFLRGLQRHPDHPELYTKFFTIMLTEASKMNVELVLEGNTQSEQSIGLQRAVVIYESAKKKIHSCDFFVNLLDITTKFPFTKKVQKQMLDYLFESFIQNELLWHTLAQRELQGHNMASLDEDEPAPIKMEDEENHNKSVTKRTLKRKIDLCAQVYATAVRELPSEKMWSYYINAMIELNEDTSTQKELRRKCLMDAYRGAYKSNFLSEQHYLQYLELLLQTTENDAFILEVLEKAREKYPNCLKLWELWMRLYIVKGDEIKTQQIFRRATKKLGDDAFPLWKLMILFYQTLPDRTSRVDKIFEEAARQTSPAFDSFKPEYLEWIALTKSIVAARKVYNELSKIPPPSLLLHEKMSMLESVQLEPDVTNWRHCHEQATHYFGRVQTDVWINYIKFERDHGDPKNMSLLYERAKQTLSEELVDNFISEHCLLTTGVI